MEFFSKEKKFKKYHRIHNKIVSRSSKLCFGIIGLRILKNICLTKEKLIMVLKLLKKILKTFDKRIKIKIRVFPDKNFTKKPRDIRMGRGKGMIVGSVCYIKAGCILLEFIGVLDIVIINEMFSQ